MKKNLTLPLIALILGSCSSQSVDRSIASIGPQTDGLCDSTGKIRFVNNSEGTRFYYKGRKYPFMVQDGVFVNKSKDRFDFIVKVEDDTAGRRPASMANVRVYKAKSENMVEELSLDQANCSPMPYK